MTGAPHDVANLFLSNNAVRIERNKSLRRKTTNLPAGVSEDAIRFSETYRIYYRLQLRPPPSGGENVEAPILERKSNIRDRESI